jgi:hypothetical protein
VPDPNGKLTPEESQQLLAWLTERWHGAGCPMHPLVPTNWEVGDMIMTLPFTGGGVSIGGPTYPLVVVTCLRCGFTVLVNAITAGLVKVPQPPSPVPPSAPPEAEK